MIINTIAATDGSEAQTLQDHPRFEDLLLRSLPALRQYALALTRNRADADDLLQNAVANALRARDSYAPGTNFKAWMSCILRNRFLSDIRRRRETVSVEDAPAELFARPASQDGHMALLELRRAMGRLRPDHRLALVMITVQADVATVQNAGQLRISSYLVKPVSPKQLGDRLRAIFA